jgi:hypothetical protein
MEIYYEFEGDEFLVIAGEEWTVGMLRNKIHEILDLVDATRHFQFTHGEIQIPAQTKFKNVDSNKMFHYRRKDVKHIPTVTLSEHPSIATDSDDLFNTEMANLSLGPSSFYNALISGEVVDGFIRWPSSLPIFDLTSVMIRECYIAIYDSILQSSQNKTRVVVTGVPGIGKSLFALYFAWRYSVDHSEKGFLFEKSADEIWLFDPRHQFRVFKRSEARGFTDIPYLVDLNEKKLPGEFIGCFGVVFSSPCPDRFKEWAKNPDISERYVMPTWSFTELELVLANKNGLEVDTDKMLRRYEKVGGVPRLVLQGSDDFFNGKLTNALSLKGQVISEKFFVGGFGNTDDDMSFLLVHIHPLKYNTDEVEYKAWTENYEFASPYIWGKLYKMNCTEIVHTARNV